MGNFNIKLKEFNKNFTYKIEKKEAAICYQSKMLDIRIDKLFIF